MTELRLPASLLAINPGLAKKAQQRRANAARGAQSKRRGASFEDEVESELKALACVADLTRCDAIVHATGSEVIYREASGCDFLGVRDTGHGFAIECKSTTAANGAVFASKVHAQAARRSRVPYITDRQRTQLDAYERVATALLAVRFASDVRIFRWRDVASLATITRDLPGWYASVSAAMMGSP